MTVPSIQSISRRIRRCARSVQRRLGLINVLDEALNELEGEERPLFTGASAMSTTSVSADVHREIRLNAQQDAKFCGNRISTAKYNVFTFLPRFLFEQFRKYANLFFLFIGCLQQIPGVSPTGNWTTLAPLLFILCLSALKEIVEDVKRHQADNLVNRKSTALVLRNKQWTAIRWQEVQVGDFIKLTDNSLIPADVLILSSSEPQGIAYIETSNLDGETNLKIRKGVPKTMNSLTAADLSELSGKVVCEIPNRHLYDFLGTIYLDNQQPAPLGPSELILRGSRLKNTPWVFGLVIYTGEESKLRLNSVPTPLKRSQIERLTNVQILLLFATLLFLSLFTAIANIVWTQKHGNNIWYVDVHVTNFILQFLTYVILYNNLIPISLQVTLEFVKFVQAYFINWDTDMVYDVTGQHAIARTSNLNEELGQIKYIFSDKTGTLTSNVMEFKGASINGTMYRDNAPGDSYPLHEMPQRVSDGHEDTKAIDRFMKFLTICHTVVPEKHENGDYTYQASSPDEAALVSGAYRLGWKFIARTPETLTVQFDDEEETFELLNVIDFTSTRKRMSVVVRDRDGTIRVLCKGADSVIFERLAPSQPMLERLERHLGQFATIGLRTLCLAEAVLSKTEYNQWNARFQEASCSLVHREQNIAAVAELLERNLQLVGVTAIEDKLQEGVPECIASLTKADIKIWVLTGDKQETAINIGYSCCLLTQDMPLMLLNTSSMEETKNRMAEVILEFGPALKVDNNIGLIIDGNTLKFALKNDLVLDFLKVAVNCKAVICCRVSPLQKAEIVALVKRYVGAITLAIGDGANDVGMIQAANVGVGIIGLEGTQAVCAADYALPRFRFLKKLLLVHGSWSYYRVCKLILYSFYKNICLYVMELWFQIYNGYSGQILFERWSIGLYNVMFTAVPPLVLGLMDRFTDKDIQMRYPQMYKISQDSTLFNVRVFWMWMMNAIFHSVILYFIPLLMLNHDNALPDGRVGGFLHIGNYAFGYTIVTVSLRAGLEAYTWTWMHFVSVFGSILLWFIYMLVYSEMWPAFPIGASEEMSGQAQNIFNNPVFWCGFIVVPTIALLRDVIWKVIRRTFFVSIKEKVEQFHELRTNLHLHSRTHSGVELEAGSTRLQEIDPRLKDLTSPPLSGNDRAATFLARIFAPAATYQFRPSLQSIANQRQSQHGYAFSQEEAGVVSQSQLVRMINSRIQKPEGK